MSLEWRVVQLERASGIINTVTDEVVLNEVLQGHAPPTILFSEWEPTVSIAASQSYALDVDAAACARHGVEVVRRKSGGKSVFLHEGYIVFSVVAPALGFPVDVRVLEEMLCRVPEDALQRLRIPAQFYPPDNLVVHVGKRVRTLGNLAHKNMLEQGFFLHGSMRYERARWDVMMDVLKVGGRKIQPYASAISDVLADVKEYNPRVTKDEIKREFLQSFAQKYGATLKGGALTSEEKRMIAEYSEGRMREGIVDAPHFVSKGICYTFVGKQNLVPALYAPSVEAQRGMHG